MMKGLKEYIASKLVGERLRFKCDCLIPFDIIGVVKDFEIVSNEVIFIVESQGKIIRIGENHPHMTVKQA